ncbi:MAG TPA: 3-deoxy-manno-octulosonate cytidylyltransferase [Gemmatimonadales bacterium]|nr:3-deoxy-manno-octulosonate cytidylyltransferase [Gemmatimonadales bacterium]
MHARLPLVAAAKVLGVIPARLRAERLPDKPLRMLAGKPLIERVARNALASGALDEVVVATDDEAVVRAAARAGCRGVLTGPGHDSGTSRVAEVAARGEYGGFDVVVNVQGDEPFLPAAAIRGAVAQVLDGADIGTAAVPLDGTGAVSPNVVKVVLREDGRAMYFSRSLIPYPRDGGAGATYWQHLGVYAFRPAALQRWMALAPTAAERAEKLEQLRPLAHGMTIGVARLAEAAQPGIDTEEDLRRAEAYLVARGESGSA